MAKAQVSDLGLVCCLVQYGAACHSRAIRAHPTSRNARCPIQKTIRLSSLRGLGPLETYFTGLQEAVATCAEGTV